MNHPRFPEATRFLAAQWVLPMDAPVIRNGYVAWLGDAILEVGALETLPEDFRIAPQPGTILTPGLINAHCHLEQSFPAPIPKAPDEPFIQWLLAVVARNRAEGSRGEIRERCRRGALELLQTGTTCANDLASGRDSLEILDELGLRGVVALECFHPGFEPVRIEPIAAAYRNFREGFQAHPRLQAALSPHSPYNVSPAAWQALLEDCRPPLVHAHVAEFEDEASYLRGEPSAIPDLHVAVMGRRFAPQAAAASPVQALLEFGLLNRRTVLAHAVCTTEADRLEIAAMAAGIVHCPRSNLALHRQTLRWADWADTGAVIGLGTDGRLSTPDLDLRAEGRAAMAIHALEAEVVLDMMTVQGARLLGLDAAIGTLSPGKQADMVLWQSDPDTLDSPAERVLNPATVPLEVVIAGETRWMAHESWF